MILGIDEVGRGPWAGPLVVGAVVFDEHTRIDGLTDSKKLSEKERVRLAVIIEEKAVAYGLGWVYTDELDEIGLSESLRLASKRAVEQITSPYHGIIIDGTVNFLSGTSKGEFVTTMKKADLLIPSVSAASILAKVARDTYMKQQDELYPGYGFAHHVGYGTAKHRAAIDEKGLTPLHRRSFAPIATYTRTTKIIGDEGEDQATDFLIRQGFEIIERNWRTRWCEIDIVAKKDDVMNFIEVKNRTGRRFGTAKEAITPEKLTQMQRAAQLYTSRYAYSGAMALGAVVIDDGQLHYLEIE